MTEKEILKATEETLPGIAGKILQQKPWKHDFPVHQDVYSHKIDHYYSCSKCGRERMAEFEACHIPDSIPLTWPNAMKWRDWITCKIRPSVADEVFSEISKFENKCFPDGAEYKKWWLWNAQPIHYIKAACLLVEKANSDKSP